MNKLHALYYKLIYGGGKDIRKPKPTGNWFVDVLKWLGYYFLYVCDAVDSKLLYSNRKVRTAKGRVRSRGEKAVVQFFEKNGIKFRYETELILDGKKLHPDFYLPEHEVYVELWGMAFIDARYNSIMRWKKKLYQKHQIPVISLYPRNLKKLDQRFPFLFEKEIGRKFSLKGGEKKSSVARVSFVSVVLLLCSHFFFRRPTMRTLLICASVLVGAALLFVPRLFTHVKQIPDQIAEKVDDSLPPGVVISEGEQDFVKAEQVLRDAYIKIYGAKVKIAKLEGELNGRHEKLAGEERVLKAAQQRLEGHKPGDQITIANTQFSYDQVNEDATNHLHMCQDLRKQIAFNEQSLSELRKAYEDGVSRINAMCRDLKRRKAQFDSDVIEYQGMMAQKEVRETIGTINSETGSLGHGLGSTTMLFDKVLNKLRASHEFDERTMLGSSGAVIPWQKELGEDERAADDIKKYFENNSTPATPVTPSTATPAPAPATPPASVSDALQAESK